jgi:hypothetical protein
MRDLAIKLKDSIQKPIASTSTTKNPSQMDKNQQLKPELPAAQDPQLPEKIAAITPIAEDESKDKPQIITAAEKESPEQITADRSSPWSRTTSADTGRHVKMDRSVRTKTTTATKTTTKSSKAKKNNRYP